MSCNDWKEVKLGDVCDTISQTYKKCKDDVVLVNTSDIFNGKVLNHTFIKNENLRGQFKKSFQKDDILYSEIRPKNRRFAYIDFDAKNYIASTKLMVLRSNESILPSYLYQHLKSESVLIELQAIAESRSGTFPQITFAELSNIPLSLPPLPKQKAIADTLSCLDDKIELNNKINKNLEAQAQAIFKSWFVDFEPFQDGEFVDSELGRIPKGWKVRELKEVADFQNGYAFYKNGYDEMGAMVIDLGNVDILGNFITTKADKFISLEKYKMKKMEKFRVRKDDLVVIMTDRKSTMDLLGKVAKISESTPFLLNQRVGRIRIKGFINVNFLYTYLNSKFLLDKLKEGALGSVQKYVNTSTITDLKLIIPNEIIMNRFAIIVNPLFEEMSNRNKQTKTLTALRDTLLPKLMSGEIRVPPSQSIRD